MLIPMCSNSCMCNSCKWISFECYKLIAKSFTNITLFCHISVKKDRLEERERVQE